MNPYRDPSILTLTKRLATITKRTVAPAAVAAAFALASLSSAHAADRKAPPPRPASEYPANDSHPSEHVTIAIDPCDNQRDCEFFRLPYVAHSMIPIRIIITNDGDTALTLDDARMQFISANNDRIPAADLEELNRRLFTIRSAQSQKLPIIPIPIHHTPIDKKITDDDHDFGFQGTIVNAHSTLAGYLFYDIKALEQPALRHAEIYVKMIHTLDRKKELFAFTIPLDKWLAAQPNPAKP
jgi:hypothetical protein